jgi:hypothetical protein
VIDEDPTAPQREVRNADVEHLGEAERAGHQDARVGSSTDASSQNEGPPPVTGTGIESFRFVATAYLASGSTIDYR